MVDVVLVDSCVFIALLRQGLDPALELLKHTALEDLATCGVVRMEVLRGIKTSKVKTRLTDFFDVLQLAATDDRVWRDATDLAWRLDRTGRVLPLTDIVIATCARRIGAGVLTFDHHFAEIPSLRVFRSLDDLG